MVSAAMLTFLNFYKREVLFVIYAFIPVFRYSALSFHLLKLPIRQVDRYQHYVVSY